MREVINLMSIDNTITKVAGVAVKVRCLLPQDGMIISERNYRSPDNSMSKYLSANYRTIVEVILPYDSDNAHFGKERKLPLTDYGKVQFILLIQKYLRMWNTSKIFYRNESNGLCIYNEMNEDGTYHWKMEEFINEYVVGFIPTIIVDPVDTNIEFEGVKMMLNQSSNYTEFTYTELYTLMHVLETLNLSAAGASLMLLYMDWLRTKPAVRKTLNKEDSSKMDKILANVSSRIRGPHSAEELEKFKKEREEDGGSKNDASEQRNENH